MYYPMRNRILILILILPTFAFSTKVLPHCDVAFYKNDTLLIDKEFSEIILQKIKKQNGFKYRENPIKVNYYTAFWKIDDNEISLIKVTNQNTLSWKSLDQADTLDLRKAFGRKYVNGKISFKSKNLTLYLHKSFIVRKNTGWFPSYLEDYAIHFKNNKIIGIDTTVNYKDNSLRLNRYSRVQLDETVFNLITTSIIIDTNVLHAKRLEFSIAITIDNAGKFDSLELSTIRVTDLSDSVYNYEFPDSIIQVELLNKILTLTLWDEMKNTNEDVAVVSYEYDCLENKLTHNRFSEYLDREKKYLKGSLPWYIIDKYEN